MNICNNTDKHIQNNMLQGTAQCTRYSDKGDVTFSYWRFDHSDEAPGS